MRHCARRSARPSGQGPVTEEWGLEPAGGSGGSSLRASEETSTSLTTARLHWLRYPGVLSPAGAYAWPWGLASTGLAGPGFWGTSWQCGHCEGRRIHTVQDSQPDPFGTAELRRRVLDAWAASPARFREDANAEEDYALGGYRDRVVVELAQNAADAAARAGVAGGLRLTLRCRNAGGGEHRGAAGRGGRRGAVHAACLEQAGARCAGDGGRPVRRGLRRRRRGQRRAAHFLAHRRGGLVAQRRPRPGPADSRAGRRARRAVGSPARAAAAVRRRRRAPRGLRDSGHAAAAGRGGRAGSSGGCSPRQGPRCCSRCPRWPPSRSRSTA